MNDLPPVTDHMVAEELDNGKPACPVHSAMAQLGPISGQHQAIPKDMPKLVKERSTRSSQFRGRLT